MTGGPLLLSLLAGPLATRAAVIEPYADGAQAQLIRLDGEIVNGDAQRLDYLVRRARAAHKRVEVLELNSLGGDMLEGVRLAQTVAKLRLKTVIPRAKSCASACFFAFSAGVSRVADSGGRLGVHGVAEREGETGRAKSMTVDMARVLGGLHVPAEVVGEMVLTPPDQMRWLSTAELRRMGVETAGPEETKLAEGPGGQRAR